MSRLLIATLAALSMLGAFSIDAYLPALPAIAGEFSVSAAAAQQSLTAYMLAFAIMTLFYGTLSDSFGRRPVIIISLGLYLLSTIGAAFANSLEMLIVFRLLQGFSGGAGAVVGRAIVGDLCQGAEAHRVMAYISAVFGVAPAIAPILGGWLQVGFGWRSIFWFIAAFAALLIIACLRVLPESLPATRRVPFHFRGVVANYLEVGSHRRFLLRALSNALAFAGLLIYVSAAPIFIMDMLRLQVTDFGWLFVPLITGMTVGSLGSAWLSHRVRSQLIVTASFALMFAASLVNLAYSATSDLQIPWAILPIAVYAIGAAAVSPIMTMMALEMFPRVRGLAASFQTFTFMLFFTLASGVFAPLLFDDPAKLAGSLVVGALFSLVCWLASSPDTLHGTAPVPAVD